jgi:hypothetical protein
MLFTIFQPLCPVCLNPLNTRRQSGIISAGHASGVSFARKVYGINPDKQVCVKRLFFCLNGTRNYLRQKKGFICKFVDITLQFLYDHEDR